LLSDSAHAEDAAQDVFLKAYKSLARFRQDSGFYTWLYKIACRTCSDLRRSRARKPTEFLSETISDPHPSAESQAVSEELLFRILDGLSEEARTVLVLREMDGLSYEEIANVLGCSVEAVKSRLRRAREDAEVLGRKVRGI